jgi:hypothetical protein
VATTSSLLARSPLDSIEERDLDLLLLTALHISQDFRTALIEKFAGMKPVEFLGAWRSVFNQYGETDVLVLVRVDGGDRLALMIEDKIDAIFQEQQAERYRRRGNLGIAEGHWDRYLTCLCAPKAFAEPQVTSGDWDRVVFVEDIEQALAAIDGLSASFLRRAIRQAVEKKENGGSHENAHATEFWRRYVELCREEFPDVMMSPLRRRQTEYDPWPRFASNELPANVRLEHKAWKGHMDLTFQKRSYREVTERLSGMLPPGLTVANTSPSAAVRASTSRLVATDSFDPQIEAVRTSFKTVRRLIALWPELRERMGYEAPIHELTDAQAP